MIKKKTFIIAEAGVNHNGKLSDAHKLIDIAEKSGADAIKFQTFNPKLLSTRSGKLAKYQKVKKNYNNQIDMLRKIELPLNSFKELSDHAQDKNLTFLSTAFDSESLDYLVEIAKVKILKIPSGEINNFQYLSWIKSKKLPMILSTGASTIQDITSAYNFLTMGEKKLNQVNAIINKKKILNKKFNKELFILHCTSEYPAPLQDLNLKCIDKLKNTFPCEIGYSDHSKSLVVPSIAVALGATIIEKHFTTNNKLKGPDHHMSLNPEQLKETIQNIRKCEISLGNDKKKVMPSEIKNKRIIRRILVANINIKKGDKFMNSNIICKRSDKGISASKYFQYIGKKSKFNFKKDESIK